MQATTTPIIDAQVHAYEHDHPGRPWVGTLAGPDEVTGADMVAAMDQVGVDGALLVSPWSMYRFDGSYAQEVGKQFPHRFGLIKPFDPQSPSVNEEIAEWAVQPGVVGARVIYLGEAPPSADDVGLNRVFAAGAKHGLPINMLCWGNVPLLGELAARNPNTRVVIDHLGLTQPFAPPAPPDPFADLDEVLKLANYDNTVIKISGACTLSHEAFPYRDIWAPLAKIFEAFGFDRCLWGTDWTRAVALLNYAQAVDAFRVMEPLSQSEREALMGGSLMQVYNWSPEVAASNGDS